MARPEVKYTPLPDPRYPSRYNRFKVGYPYDDTGDYFKLAEEEKESDD